MEKEERVDELLAKVDADKRNFLKKLGIGTAFALPIILSFGMDGVKARAAAAQSGLRPPPASPF